MPTASSLSVDDYLSSFNASPPAGASADFVATTSFFAAREVEAKVNDRVTTAALAMRRNILVFILEFLKLEFVSSCYLGSLSVPPPPLSSVVGLTSSSVHAVTDIVATNASSTM